MNAKLLPYLNFMGKTREAMEFYKSVLGGELIISTFGESGAPVKDEFKDWIMHAELKNGELTFMASDGYDEKPVHMGDNINMSIVGTDEAQISKYFEGLSEGAKVEMPLEKAPWGDKFGMLTDKFGVHWMVNISSEGQNNG